MGHCECGKRCRYDERYDAYYCVACDDWRSPNCDEVGCFYCVGRPAKPSQLTKDLKIESDEDV